MTTLPQLHSQRPARRSRLWPALAPLPLLLAFLLPLPHDGAIAKMPRLCLFFLSTGLPCPGCGLTRSVVSFAHGQWSEAVYYHPLGPLFFIAFVAIAAGGVLQFFYPRQVTGWTSKLLEQKTLTLLSASLLGVALITIWLARLAGWLPSPP
jgi:hypothetical protein